MGTFADQALVKIRQKKYDINKAGGGASEGVLTEKLLAILQFLSRERAACERSVAKKGPSLFLISMDDQPDTLKDRLSADDTIINNTADEPKQLHVTARQTQN